MRASGEASTGCIAYQARLGELGFLASTSGQGNTAEFKREAVRRALTL